VRRLALVLTALITAAIVAPATRMPVRATFTADSLEHAWTLAELDPQLPADWTPYDFLVLQFKASSSQRFDLGIETADGRIAKRIGPFAGVWVRAAIPLRFYRDAAGSAGDLARPQPAARFLLINIHSGIVGPTVGVRALTVTMPDPVGSPTLEIRSVSLAKTDPGDAVLDAGPLIDQFGQYVHAAWPGKARSLEDLRKAWTSEDEGLARFRGERCEYGGFAGTRAKATGYFRVERVGGTWWFVDPDGHLFLSTGVNGVGTSSGTRVQGREALFEALPPAELGSAARVASFYTWNLQRRHGDDWRAKWAEAAGRRLAAWGFNSIHYWGPRGQAGAEEPRVPYAQMLRWQLGPAIMGMPDVYAEDFARRVDQSAAAQLIPAAATPDARLLHRQRAVLARTRGAVPVDLLLAAPVSEMQRARRPIWPAATRPSAASRSCSPPSAGTWTW
jgi:hypothetical protein